MMNGYRTKPVTDYRKKYDGKQCKKCHRSLRYCKCDRRDKRR